MAGKWPILEEMSLRVMFVLFFSVHTVFVPAALSQLPPFMSFKAPKEVIHNYDIVKPVVRLSGFSANKAPPLYLTVYLRTNNVNYTLHLKQNVGLLSPKFTSRNRAEDGVEHIQKGHTNCFYHGTVAEQSNWSVLMSTCHGLRGALGPLYETSQHLHLEPLHPNSGTKLDQLHVLYEGSQYSNQEGSCGTKEGDGVTQQTHHSLYQKRKVSRQSPVTLVEWTVVNDNAQFMAFSQNLTAVVLRSIEIANGIDLIYRNEGVRIAVVDVITWTTSNQIQIVDDPEASLNNFQKGALNLSQIYDSAMLLTGISFTGNTIGIAYTGTMCSDRLSVGLVEDAGRDLSHVISTTAHELGHIFGMNHDTSKCTCSDSTGLCIMAETLGSPPPTIWSSCSVDTLKASIGGELGRCLGNQPSMTVADPSCGNGIQEEGEGCDCGTSEECLDRCCNATTCQLVASAACRAGECCLPNCLFVPYGTTCRNVSRECDIAEYCTGDSADCPKDVYLQDLTFCNDNESYCFSGSCNTRDKQCMEHFKTESATDDCYTVLNARGNVFGHCGHNKTSYIPCAMKDAFCGQIQCVPGTLQTPTGFITTYKLPIELESHICRSVTTRNGSDQISPGLIRDGTICGSEMVCLSSRCVFTSAVDIKPCPKGNNGEICSSQGLCNNNDECSCFVDFRGAACDKSQGSSEDKGFGTIAGAVIGVLLPLIILGVAIIAGVFILWRSKSARSFTKRFIPCIVFVHKPNNGQSGHVDNTVTPVHFSEGFSSTDSTDSHLSSRPQLSSSKGPHPAGSTKCNIKNKPSPPAARPKISRPPPPHPNRPLSASNRPPIPNRPPPPMNRPPPTNRPLPSRPSPPKTGLLQSRLQLQAWHYHHQSIETNSATTDKTRSPLKAKIMWPPPSD